MNWLKLITRSGRQSVARELMKEYLSPEKVADYTAEGVNRLLEKVNDKTRLGSVATNVNNVANLAAKVADAVRDGHVDAREMSAIVESAHAITEFVLTKERIDALVEKAVSYVP